MMDNSQDPFIILEAKQELFAEERRAAIDEAKARILADRTKKKWYHRIFPYRIIIERL